MEKCKIGNIIIHLIVLLTIVQISLCQFENSRNPWRGANPVLNRSNNRNIISRNDLRRGNRFLASRTFTNNGRTNELTRDQQTSNRNANLWQSSDRSSSNPLFGSTNENVRASPFRSNDVHTRERFLTAQQQPRNTARNQARNNQRIPTSRLTRNRLNRFEEQPDHFLGNNGKSRRTDTSGRHFRVQGTDRLTGDRFDQLREPVLSSNNQNIRESRNIGTQTTTDESSDDERRQLSEMRSVFRYLQRNGRLPRGYSVITNNGRLRLNRIDPNSQATHSLTGAQIQNVLQFVNNRLEGIDSVPSERISRDNTHHVKSIRESSKTFVNHISNDLPARETNRQISNGSPNSINVTPNNDMSLMSNRSPNSMHNQMNNISPHQNTGHQSTNLTPNQVGELHQINSNSLNQGTNHQVSNISPNQFSNHQTNQGGSQNMNHLPRNQMQHLNGFANNVDEHVGSNQNGFLPPATQSNFNTHQNHHFTQPTNNQELQQTGFIHHQANGMPTIDSGMISNFKQNDINSILQEIEFEKRKLADLQQQEFNIGGGKNVIQGGATSKQRLLRDIDLLQNLLGTNPTFSTGTSQNSNSHQQNTQGTFQNGFRQNPVNQQLFQGNFGNDFQQNPANEQPVQRNFGNEFQQNPVNEQPVTGNFDYGFQQNPVNEQPVTGNFGNGFQQNPINEQPVTGNFGNGFQQNPVNEQPVHGSFGNEFQQNPVNQQPVHSDQWNHGSVVVDHGNNNFHQDTMFDQHVLTTARDLSTGINMPNNPNHLSTNMGVNSQILNSHPIGNVEQMHNVHGQNIDMHLGGGHPNDGSFHNTHTFQNNMFASDPSLHLNSHHDAHFAHPAQGGPWSHPHSQFPFGHGLPSELLQELMFGDTTDPPDPTTPPTTTPLPVVTTPAQKENATILPPMPKDQHMSTVNDLISSVSMLKSLFQNPILNDSTGIQNVNIPLKNGLHQSSFADKLSKVNTQQGRRIKTMAGIFNDLHGLDEPRNIEIKTIHQKITETTPNPLQLVKEHIKAPTDIGLNKVKDTISSAKSVESLIHNIAVQEKGNNTLLIETQLRRIENLMSRLLLGPVTTVKPTTTPLPPYVEPDEEQADISTTEEPPVTTEQSIEKSPVNVNQPDANHNENSIRDVWRNSNTNVKHQTATEAPHCNPHLPNFGCEGIGMFQPIKSINAWCVGKCVQGHCIESVCECGCYINSKDTNKVHEIGNEIASAITGTGSQSIDTNNTLSDLYKSLNKDASMHGFAVSLVDMPSKKTLTTETPPSDVQTLLSSIEKLIESKLVQKHDVFNNNNNLALPSINQIEGHAKDKPSSWSFQGRSHWQTNTKLQDGA